MTLSCAIRIAHASSKFVFPFAQRGITMESISSFFLPRLIGYSDAIYLLTTGEAQRGDSKFFRSLFHEVYEDREQVLRRAMVRFFLSRIPDLSRKARCILRLRVLHHASTGGPKVALAGPAPIRLDIHDLGSFDAVHMMFANCIHQFSRRLRLRWRRKRVD